MTGRRLSLSFIVLSSVAFLLLLTWLLLSVITSHGAQKMLTLQKQEQARLLVASAGRVAASTADGWTGRPLAEFANSLASQPGFVSFVVADADRGAILRKNGTTPAVPGDATVAVSQTFNYAGHPTTVALTLSLAPEHARAAAFNRLFFAYFILDFLLLLTVGSLILSRFVISPVKRVVAATARVAAGDLAHRVPVVGGMELAELAESFNAMTSSLKRKDEEAAEYVRSLEKANRNLREAREEALRAEKMASIGMLAAGMAHEVGTPLGSIMGYADILQEELEGDGEKRDYVRRIADDARRIDRIVRGLLDYARPRPPQVEKVRIDELLAATLELLRAQGVLKRITVTLHAEDAVPPVLADPHQLQQVFINLLVNARDAMPEGGVAAVTVKREGKAVLVEVADAGPGIPPDDLPRLFDPFFTTKEPGKGTGLGLSISARIVHDARGIIRAANRAGGGASFVVELPAAEGGSDGP